MKIKHVFFLSIALALFVLGSLSCRGNTVLVPDNENTGTRFVGRATCSQCHNEINTEYSSQAHGIDFRKKNGSMDLVGGYGGACVPCHTTGYKESTGYQKDGSTPYLEGIGCEECHGMGSDHAVSPSKSNIRRVPKATESCYDCHVPDYHGENYKVLDIGIGAITDAELRDVNPDEPVHHPQTAMLLGVLGYNRTNEKGAHRFVDNTCTTCHLYNVSPNRTEHGESALKVDFEACVACHNDAVTAYELQQNLEKEINATLIELGGEDPANPGAPDGSARGGLLAAYALTNGIVLDSNNNPDNPAVKIYKAAHHNYTYVINDKSFGTHNPGYVRGLLEDARLMLGASATAQAFVGRSRCSTCHQSINDEYSEQAHGIDFRHKNGSMDLVGGYGGSCAPCHTTGFNEPTGYNPNGSTPYLEGIGCEECHGMGKLHANGFSVESINRIPKSSDTCYDCHVPDYHGENYKVLDIGIGAITDAELRDQNPDLAVHHPQTAMLLGALGYNRTGEPGVHASIDNTCTTCHLSVPEGGYVEHGDSVLQVDYFVCADCHGSSVEAMLLSSELELEVYGLLIELGGASPENPNEPDESASGGLLAAYATAHGIVLDSNNNPDDPFVKNYKAAKHDFSYIISDKSHGVHNAGFARSLLEDAKALLE